MKLRPKYSNVLECLARNRDKFVMPHSIPNGHGHVYPGGVSKVTLRELTNLKWIEYGKEPQQGTFGYKITELGLEVLLG